MTERVVPDDTTAGAFFVKFGEAAQSWVDPARPEMLAFEYVQHVAMILDAMLLEAEPDKRLRVVHVGGAGMSLPRWIAWRRPGTAQIVLEPDAALTAEVRRKLPLPQRSGIKVRDVDGRTGVAAMAPGYTECIIVDAFDGDTVPGELVTQEFWQQCRRIGRGPGLLIINVTDRAPFAWAKRVAAGLQEHWRHVVVGAEPAVHKGKRFGNLVMIAAGQRLAMRRIQREANRLPFGYRWLQGASVRAWIGGATAFTDVDTAPSAPPSGSKLWFQ